MQKDLNSDGNTEIPGSDPDLDRAERLAAKHYGAPTQRPTDVPDAAFDAAQKLDDALSFLFDDATSTLDMTRFAQVHAAIEHAGTDPNGPAWTTSLVAAMDVLGVLQETSDLSGFDS